MAEASDIVKLSSRGLPVRVLLIVAIAASLVFIALAGKWQIGDMLATLTPPEDDNAAAIADLAAGLAPSDPAASVLVGRTGVDPIPALERAVRLAPADYRWRIELGRALEQDDQYDRAQVE